MNYYIHNNQQEVLCCSIMLPLHGMTMINRDKLYEPLLKNPRSKQSNRSSFQACTILQLKSPFFWKMVPHPNDISTLPDKTIAPSRNVRQHPPCDAVPQGRRKYTPPVQMNASYKHVEKHNKSRCEERENQQDATIRCLLSTSVSTCFGHH